MQNIDNSIVDKDEKNKHEDDVIHVEKLGLLMRLSNVKQKQKLLNKK